MPDQRSTRCPACRSGKVFSLGTKHSRFRDREHAYLGCGACAFKWVYPFPGYEIYNDDYYREKGPDPYVDYEKEYNDYRSTDRVLEFTDLLRVFKNHYTPEQGRSAVNWLEFGCGSGGLLKFLRDNPVQHVAGRELEIRAAGHDIGTYAKRLAEVDGFTILQEADFQKLEGTFDVISCIEVLEHVLDFHLVLGQISKLLRPGGLLLLTTGNLTSLAARMAGLNYRYMIPEIHISLFNPGVLEQLYAANGLTAKRVRYNGVIRFKVVKSLQSPALKRVARILLKFPPLVRAIDAFYGVSAMPCAVKPLKTG